MAAGSWRLVLSSRGTLEDPGGSTLPLERKAAALLAYLALEGPTPRSRLAGLLWPESPERAARNNLTQVLRRLRRVTGTELVWDNPVGGLALAPVLCLPAGPPGNLLAQHAYDDCPDLDDWLAAARERGLSTHLDVLRAAASAAEAGGDLAEALRLNAERLRLDPVSEEAHRTAMRLHYLLGDRASALAAYHHCQEVLRRELGVDPLPETVGLARDIGQAELPIPPRRAPLPLAVHRPPVLIGREREWAAMQAAWDAGKGILLIGDPGVGKTRLMRDFVTAHGAALHFEGRPGDPSVPYASQARALARLLEQFPDLPLPDWVRPELARLLPHLGEAPPITREAEKLRFYQAVTETVRAATRTGTMTVAFDDLQFADPASLEVGQYVLGALWSDPGVRLRGIFCHRRGELHPQVQADIDAIVAAGRLVRVELLPLDPAGVGTLLRSLGPTLPPGQDEAVYRATGGNPLFVLETVRSWLESGKTDDARRMGSQAGQVIAGRLGRLSPEALKLARAAAVAQGDFGPELAGCMRDRDPLDLVEAWTELERASILQGNAFTHDLIGEAVAAELPQAVGHLLHRRAAGGLEALGAPAARIAEHWLAAGAEEEALPHLLAAARQAEDAWQFDVAHGHYLRAADVARRAGRREEAFEALYNAYERLIDSGTVERVKTFLDALQEVATTPKQRVLVQNVRFEWHSKQGELDTAIQVAQLGLLEAELAGLAQPRARMMQNIANTYMDQGRYQEAAELCHACIPLLQSPEDQKYLAELYSSLAFLYLSLDRNADAIAYFSLARELSAKSEPVQEVILLHNLATSQRLQGDVRASMRSLDEARGLLGKVTGAVIDQMLNVGQRGDNARLLGQYDRALQAFEEARRIGEGHGLPSSWWLASVARLHTDLAQYERSVSLHEEAARAPRLSVRSRGQIRLNRAVLEVRRGQPAGALFQEAHELLDMNRSLQAEANLAWCLILPPDDAARRAGEALALARELGNHGLELTAHVRLASAWLSLGQAEQALEHADAALRLSRDYAATYVTRIEVLDTYARVLAALGHPEAGPALRAAVGALREVAEGHVPEPYREAFLWRHPLHRALLERAAQTGAEAPATPPSPGRLTEAQWSAVRGLLAAQATSGRPRSDDRAVLEGVLWKLATGRGWRELPPEFPPFSTCHRRSQEWLRRGVLGRVLARLWETSKGGASESATLALLRTPGCLSLLREVDGQAASEIAASGIRGVAY